MQDSIICEDCGTKVPAGTKSCPSCGLSFEAQSEWEERVDHGVGEAFPLPPEEARSGKAEEIQESGHQKSKPAGFWMRAAAVFVDQVLMNVLTYGLGIAIAIALGGVDAVDSQEPEATVGLAIIAISLLVPMAYYALMESSSMQATLGKKLVGIKVTDLRGNRIGLGRAMGRYFGKILSAMTLMIGFMMAGWTKEKQAMHDMIAGTLVVRR